MKNKVCVVTGATGGIGMATAKMLAQKGMHMVLACRNMEKAEAVCNKIKDKTGNPHVDCIKLDLASFNSIESFADEFLQKYARLDILINNAGAICDTRRYTEQGFEMTMGVNYIGPYYLTELLLPLLYKAKSARIVNVSSIVGIHSTMHEQVLDFYDLKPGLYVYTASKFAQVLYTIEMAKILSGSNVTVNALHPGIYGTNIWSGERPLIRYTQPFMKFFLPSPKKGAKAITYLATSPDLAKVNGALFMKTKKVEPKNGALDSMLRKKLIEHTQTTVEEAIKCKKNIAI